MAASLDAVHNLDISFLQPIIDSAASFVTSIFGYLILPAWLFFLLKDRAATAGPRWTARCPKPWRRDTWAIVGIVDRVFARWLRGQLLLGLRRRRRDVHRPDDLALSVAPVFGLRDPARDHRGVLELVPIIGRSSRRSRSSSPAPRPGSRCARRPDPRLRVQQVENNFLVPKIQSDAIDLHPALVIAG